MTVPAKGSWKCGFAPCLSWGSEALRELNWIGYWCGFVLSLLRLKPFNRQLKKCKKIDHEREKCSSAWGAIYRRKDWKQSSNMLAKPNVKYWKEEPGPVKDLISSKFLNTKRAKASLIKQWKGFLYYLIYNTSKSTVFLHQGISSCGFGKLVRFSLNETSFQYQTLVLSNESMKVELPQWKIWKGNVSSVSPSLERIRSHAAP